MLRQAGASVSVEVLRRRNGYGLAGRIRSRAVALVRPQAAADVQIFLEALQPGWLRCARVNCLIPNQEQFDPSGVAVLGRLDRILCKTRYAARVFEGAGRRVEFVGFSGADAFQPGVPKDYRQFLHVAGKSVWKGTDRLVDVWSRHPEWPTLRVVRRGERPGQPARANIRHHGGHVAESQLREWQNACGVHLCPSVAEGFGHSISEGLSAAAVVVTTDAPPMNELVTPDRGVLVRYGATKPSGMGTNYYFDEVDLERQVGRVLAMDESALAAIGRRAREWYLENDRAFRARVAGAVLSLASGGGRA